MKLPKYPLFLLALFGIAGLFGLGIFIPGQLRAAVVDFGLGNPEAGWFQIVGGDIHADGDIQSPVPVGETFMIDPQGVVSHEGKGEFNGQDPQWLVNDNTINLSAFNYSYFSSNISAEIFPCNPSDANNCWANLPSGNYLYTGTGTLDLPSSTVNINSAKIVVLVNGNLNINGKIRVGEEAFLAFIVNGSINVASDAGVDKLEVNPSLEGLYFAQGTFNTGTSIDGKERLIAKGIFAAQGGFNLQRNLGVDNETMPAEVFIFDPGLLAKMPEAMKKTAMSWTEVAP